MELPESSETIATYFNASQMTTSKTIVQNCSPTTATSASDNDLGYNNGHQKAPNYSPIVDRAITVYFEVSFWVVSNFLVSTFGSVSNIINIIVYAKMGLQDVVNISLLGLAVSDFISVVTVVWLSICYGMILLDPPGLPFDPAVFMYVTAGWPHFMFSRTSCYITAMVSIERCLCVVAPFKVNRIVTPTRIKICLVFILVAFPSAYLPALIQHKLTWKFDARHNETRIMADFTARRKEIQAKSYYANGLLFPTIAFFIVIFCVIITAQSLLRKVEWKKEHNFGIKVDKKDNIDSATDRNKDGGGASIKELRVVRMLTVICVMFVVCYAPSVVMLYVRVWVPGLEMFGKHHNLFILIYSFIFFMEIFNSSINIIIYYFMSTKYREAFTALFGASKK